MLLYSNSPSDVDKVFEDQYLAIFSERGCTPQVPPNLEAMRSIIMKKGDPSIYDQSSNSIRDELERENPWLKVKTL